MASGVFSHADLEAITHGFSGGGGGSVDLSGYLQKNNDEGTNLTFKGNINFPEANTFKLSYEESSSKKEVTGKDIVDIIKNGGGGGSVLIEDQKRYLIILNRILRTTV